MGGEAVEVDAKENAIPDGGCPHTPTEVIGNQKKDSEDRKPAKHPYIFDRVGCQVDDVGQMNQAMRKHEVTRTC